MYFCLLHFYWPPSNCHVHISLPCFLTSEIIKESMRDSKNFKAHLKMCKDYMGSTLQNDLELQYSLQHGQNTDTRFNAQVSELKKNLTVRYSFGTPFKSSSQDNCSQKFKCQILWSSTFLHNPILDTCCSYVISLKVFFSFLNDHLSTLPVACYFLVILILSITSMFLPRYILLILFFFKL